MAGLQPINRQTLQNHRLTVAGMSDEQYAPLYDFANYRRGYHAVSFFTQPQGQGVSTAPGAPAGSFKSEADTNLTNAGMLPRDQWFFITASKSSPFRACCPAVVVSPMRPRAVHQRHLDARQVRVPEAEDRHARLRGRRSADGFPTTQGIGGFAAMATNLTTGAATFSEIDYARFVGQPVHHGGLWITPTQNFSVSLNWPGLVPTFSTTIARLGIRLRVDSVARCSSREQSKVVRKTTEKKKGRGDISRPPSINPPRTDSRTPDS